MLGLLKVKAREVSVGVIESEGQGGKDPEKLAEVWDEGGE